MAFVKANINETEFSPAKAIGENWGVLTGTSENGFNSMTVSWGAAGVLWSRPCIFVFVRPQRYTYGFMEDGEFFSLSLMPEGAHKQIAVFGSKSGRDCDKYAEAGIEVGEYNGVKYCAAAEKVFICRKIAAADMTPEWFIDKGIIEEDYPRADYHRMYIGEVRELLVRE